MAEHGETIPVPMSEDEKARRLAEMDTNEAMMRAAAGTSGVPGQSHVVESHQPDEMSEVEAKAANPDLITSDDVPKPEAE